MVLQLKVYLALKTASKRCVSVTEAVTIIEEVIDDKGGIDETFFFLQLEFVFKF